MRPIQLQLRNFLSYGEGLSPLRFDGMHVVCLSGPNGHGKSALLDAITWALWGRARTRSDDDLIRHGSTEMLVDMEFALEDQRYRVRRERIRRGTRGRSVLEFFVWDEAKGTWRALTEATIRETQRRILETIKLDYETFVNSAYLKQGEADAFTTKSPGERKRILAEILRLDQYDALEQRAREHMREAEREIASLEGIIHNVQEEIAHEAEYEAELREAEALLARVEQELQLAEAREGELQAQREALHQLEAEVQRQKARVRDLEAEVHRADADIAGLEAKLHSLREHLTRREEIEARYRELQRLREESATWDDLLRQQAALQQRLQKAQEALHEARVAAERELARLRQQAAELQARAARGEAARQALAKAEAQLTHFAAMEEEIQALRERAMRIQEERATLRESLRRLKDDMNELKERIQQLEEARGAPNCPLCGQPLSDDHVAHMLDTLRAEGRQMGDTFRAGRDRLAALEAELKETQAALKRLEAALQEQGRWQRLHAQSEREVRQAEEAAAALADLDARIRDAEAALESGAFAPELTKAVQDVTEALARLGYDAQAHERVRRRLADLADAEAAYRELASAAEKVQELEERLREARERRERWAETLAREVRALEEMQERLAVLPEVEKAWRAQVTEVNRLAEQEREARTRVGAARQRLSAIAQQKVRLERLQVQLQESQEKRTIYQELAQAFGRNGLQAMIIEAVLPEIEQEANRLLARMTDGRMTVRLKTQRELRSGGSAETLDIEIADDAGVRPYELYSGGEAFRINFALRVALSKLLARRAGASLRSLFIDEGFGSQDSEGRLRLVEAINAIQDEFDLILVITHIEELKEAFPVRIEVFKGPNGSTYTVT